MVQLKINEIVLYEQIDNVLSSFIKIDSITNNITPIDYDYTNVQPCIIIIQLQVKMNIQIY